jgi:hypothetical protein
MEKDASGTYTVTCKNGTKEYKVAMSQIQSNEVCGVTQVNPKAFNAFNIWRDGNGAEILDYPLGYDVQDGPPTPDGVFYVEN